MRNSNRADVRCSMEAHYALLLEENNDPVNDPPPLREYMRRWDGAPFLELLQLCPNKTVLKIGVGTGRLALEVAPHCKKLTGIDLTPEVIARARVHLAGLPNVSLLCGDFLLYPFTETFDIVYSSLVFMHIREKQAAITKVRSLLKPGGCFVLSIDQNQTPVLDMGTRQISLYPDNLEDTRHYFQNAGLRLEACLTIEAAHILVGTPFS